MNLIVASITLSFLCLIGNIDATENRRKLTPQEVGFEHNRICLNVRDRIQEKTPEHEGEYLKYMAEEMMDICDESDEKCQDRIHVHIANAKAKDFANKNFDTYLEDAWPDDLDDKEMFDVIKEIYTSINDLKTMELAHVADRINSISDKYSNTDTDDAKKFVVQIAASVAGKSAELWTGVFSDPDDAFHSVYGGFVNTNFSDDGSDRRRLQGPGGQDEEENDGEGDGMDPIAIALGVSQSRVGTMVQADMVGALMNGFNALPSYIAGETETIGAELLMAAVGDSLGAFLQIMGLTTIMKSDDSSE